MCSWCAGSDIAAFDVTSSDLRLHTPAQVWAPCEEAVQISASLSFFFFFSSTDPRKSEEEARFRGADGEAAF